MATCRGCGEIIEFVLSKKGKRIPVDLPLATHALTPGTVIVTPEGEVLRGSEATKDTRVQGYVSHFASCQYAESFRKPR